MSHTPHVLIVGTGFAGRWIATKLKEAGRHDFVVLEIARRVDSEVVSYDFDEETDRWRVQTRTGDMYFPRIVVAAIGSLHKSSVHIVGRRGLTIQDAWRDDMEPYLGVMVAGFPNFFLMVDPQARYIMACLAMMEAQDATRIDVRGGAQREFNRRIHRNRYGMVWTGSRRRSLRRPDSNAFELSNLDEREQDTEFSGSAVLSAGGRTESVQVHLNGHFEPLDGRYHWYGRVVGDVVGFKKPNGSPLVLTIGDGPETPAALAEEDPWGNYRITGVGTPPFTVQPTP